MAVLILLAALVCLDLMNAIVKHLLPRYEAVELSAWRNIIGMLPSLVILFLSEEMRSGRASWRMRQWPLAMMRGLFTAVAQLLLYVALAGLAFATVTTLVQTLSFFVVVLSVPLLGERIGPWRWAAVAIGFAGAVLIMRPGSDAFSWLALLPVGAAALYALAAVTARMIDGAVPNALVYLYSAVSATIWAVVLALSTTGMALPQTWLDAGMIFAMGCLGGVGVMLLLVSARMTSPARLSPFKYTAILISIFTGWLLFDELPIDTLFPGVLLIVAAGLIVVWRESRGKRAPDSVLPSKVAPR